MYSSKVLNLYTSNSVLLLNSDLKRPGLYAVHITVKHGTSSRASGTVEEPCDCGAVANVSRLWIATYIVVSVTTLGAELCGRCMLETTVDVVYVASSMLS